MYPYLGHPPSPGFLPSLRRLVRNKALMTQTLALSCLSTAVLIYVHYDGAYVQVNWCQKYFKMVKLIRDQLVF